MQTILDRTDKLIPLMIATVVSVALLVMVFAPLVGTAVPDNVFGLVAGVIQILVGGGIGAAGTVAGIAYQERRIQARGKEQ